MASGLAAESLFELPEQHESAPSSADFYLPSQQEPVGFEQPRIVDFPEFEDQPFRRFTNGIIDLESYRPYLMDASSQVPPRSPSEVSGWKDQHIWFTERAYRQIDVYPVESRDPFLAALRSHAYSQLVMRSFLEHRMHQNMEPEVSQPDNGTTIAVAGDYLNLDVVGGTVLGLDDLANPRPRDEWYERNNIPLPEIEALTDTDKERILNEYLVRALEALEKPRALPSEWANSALVRIANHLGSEALAATAKARFTMQGDYYPIKVPKRGHFRAVVAWVLKDAVGIQSLEQSRDKYIALRSTDSLAEVA